MKRHYHAWKAAAPIDPAGDPHNFAAYVADLNPKTTTWACSCGAVKMILTTGGFANAYITRANGRLWRGRRRSPRLRVGQVSAGRARTPPVFGTRSGEDRARHRRQGVASGGGLATKAKAVNGEQPSLGR